MSALHHVALETRREDVEACAAFFELLGFERVPVPGAIAQVADWVERDGQQIHLRHADDPVVGPLAHVAIVCPDYEEAVGRLEAAGFEITRAEPAWGSPRCFAWDPAGHRVEVMAFPPGG